MVAVCTALFMATCVTRYVACCTSAVHKYKCLSARFKSFFKYLLCCFKERATWESLVRIVIRDRCNRGGLCISHRLFRHLCNRYTKLGSRVEVRYIRRSRAVDAECARVFCKHRSDGSRVNIGLIILPIRCIVGLIHNNEAYVL